jgi:acetyl/propionyl-CoA carboxylase alpha subunit/acetyl-CoA carboxylase carboxyltransferase component
MGLRRLLIANRGEIAVRLARTASELGIETVAVFSEDDAGTLHVRHMTSSVPLVGVGPPAYLDVAQVVGAAVAAGCDALHPGYGLLSERAELAKACADAGITFVGPTVRSLRLLGDKTEARQFARSVGVPTLPGTSAASLGDVEEFFDAHGAVMIKAVAGGGGRGMRIVTRRDELAAAYERCQSEAVGGFGSGAVYVEQLLDSARHIEIQVIGDAERVLPFGDRECTLQRRHQKILEVAPSPSLTPELRKTITDAAVRIAAALNYQSLGTFEFLVDSTTGSWFFIEANSRIQVEHTVTEAVTGLDLVELQLRLAGGETLDEALPPKALGSTNGCAVQLRILTERLMSDGSIRPTGGTISALGWPTGSGIRIDSAAEIDMAINPRFDSLLAKLIVHSPGNYASALSKASRAIGDFHIEGVVTNASLLRRLVEHPDVIDDRVSTRFIDDHAAELCDPADVVEQPIAQQPTATSQPLMQRVSTHENDAVKAPAPSGQLFDSRPVDGTEPSPADAAAIEPASSLVVEVRAPMPGTIVSVSVPPGSSVRAGQQLLVMEAMKMEHVIVAPCDGEIADVLVTAGLTVNEGDVLVNIHQHTPSPVAAEAADTLVVDPAHIRPDLAEVVHRQFLTSDAARPDAVARRRTTVQRTARENIDDLCDPGSFNEYGSLAIAAQRRRRTVEDLIAKTPADGMVAGLGTVNRDLVGDERAQTMVISYDYMVLAGTQGQQNHRKKDRMFELAKQLRTPVVFFTEGGGGRPGDTDGLGVAGLDCMAFALWGQLSGLVPMIGINSGRCFAGNAAILGCCDVIIATANSSIGMGGPAMIEGGGLGVYHPDEIGPMSVQVPSGVVDIAVADEAEAVAVAKKYLSYFQGRTSGWEAADQRLLRSVIPKNRKRVYDVRQVINLLADHDSVLEIRPHFGIGMITAFARIEGRPVGIIANNPMQLAGAIDSDGADKAARFMQLCDAYDIPIVSLCDTPGMMVGPDVEATALVRHCSRLFVIAGSISVPLMTVVLRKGYGLGAQAMAGGSFKVPLFTVAWPTGEFGGMGLEGAVKLGYRKELEAIEDPTERASAFDAMVDRMYEHGKAVSMASHFEIDDVIDPADTRARIAATLAACPPPPKREGKKRPCIDTW